jgi:acetyl-CoA synthetase
MGGAEHPPFLLYTWSTGKPKGVQHPPAATRCMPLTTKWTFDLKDDDVTRTADIGWSPATPSPMARRRWARRGRYSKAPTIRMQGAWKMIQDHQVTVFYTAPTAIRR